MESIRMKWWIVHTETARGIDQAGGVVFDRVGYVVDSRGDSDAGSSVGMGFVDLGTEDCRATATSPGQLGVRW